MEDVLELLSFGGDGQDAYRASTKHTLQCLGSFFQRWVLYIHPFSNEVNQVLELDHRSGNDVSGESAKLY